MCGDWCILVTHRIIEYRGACNAYQCLTTRHTNWCKVTITKSWYEIIRELTVILLSCTENHTNICKFITH